MITKSATIKKYKGHNNCSSHPFNLFSSFHHRALLREILYLKFSFFCKYNQLHNSYMDEDRRPPRNLHAALLARFLLLLLRLGCLASQVFSIYELVRVEILNKYGTYRKR